MTTNTHHENFEKLRDFLLTNDVPFDMFSYRSQLDWDTPMDWPTKDDFEKGKLDCGTAGCAIGWAPFVVKPDNACYEFGNDRELSYEAYCLKHFGVAWSDREFEWLFGSRWQAIDNTRQGAAYRIDLFLKKGAVVVVRPEKLSLREIEEYIEARDEWLKERGISV